MQASFRLGRIAGIDVGIHWSWLIVVALIVWSLAAAVFPESTPGLSDGTYVVMAVVAALLFFTSLFLHELGHAITAQREGMEIEGITLWVFGGVAKFKGMFPSARAEFRIAIAGPLVTLVLSAVFLLFSAIQLPDSVFGVAFWLGYINLFLLGFNMLPALPLDGGRVLRAAIWHFKESFQDATRLAAGLGRVFGQLLIAAGFALVIFVAAFGGVWLALIGWFLMMAAESEARVAEARQALRGLRVADVMVRDPVTADPDLPLDRFMDDVFFRHRHTTYPVTDDGTTLGLVSFRRVAEVDRREWPARRVRDFMTPVDQTLVLAEERDLGEALSELAQSDLNRALVCEEGRLSGLLSITDASRVLEVRAGPRHAPAPVGAGSAGTPRRS